MLDLENIPCPISPQNIPIKYETKLEAILKKLILSPHKDCLKLYTSCLIEKGLLRILVRHMKYSFT